MKQLIATLVIIIVAPLFMQSGAVLTACTGGGDTAQGQILSGAGAAGNCNATSVNKLARDIVSIISILVGVAAVIMIIYGGFRYVTSGGDAGRVAAAKSTLIYAIVGLVIAALAQLIVHYVLNKAVNV